MTKCRTYKLHYELYNVINKEERMFIMRNFKIPVIPKSTPKTIRFPDSIIERVENAIKGCDCTFSAFVVEATRDALEQIEK